MMNTTPAPPGFRKHDGLGQPESPRARKAEILAHEGLCSRGSKQQAPNDPRHAPQ
jgi:hypothetical protein